MAWFNRKERGIQTPSKKKLEIPDGLWSKTPKGSVVHKRELKQNAYVSVQDGFHFRIGSQEYFEILFDEARFEELFSNLYPLDPLNFVDTKRYKDRLVESREKTGLTEAARVGIGKIKGLEVVVGAMDFVFIGGSMGSVVGEKFFRAIDYAYENDFPLVLVCKSGGARMMESAISLMQMGKVAGRLNRLVEKKIPYISVLTDPTTGGVTASFAMLGDFILAEPGALIAFAGPRIVKETIKKDLPPGFQRSEFLLENGFIDFIMDRRQLKDKISLLLGLIGRDSSG